LAAVLRLLAVLLLLEELLPLAESLRVARPLVELLPEELLEEWARRWRQD